MIVYIRKEMNEKGKDETVKRDRAQIAIYREHTGTTLPWLLMHGCGLRPGWRVRAHHQSQRDFLGDTSPEDLYGVCDI